MRKELYTAVRWTGKNLDEIKRFVGLSNDAFLTGTGEVAVKVNNRNHRLFVPLDTYLIKDDIGYLNVLSGTKIDKEFVSMDKIVERLRGF